MILLLLLAMHQHQMEAKHPPHHHGKVVCHTYATKGPFKGIKDCK